jgi:hypothetical protein
VTPTTVPGILVVYHRPDYRLTPRPFADAATVREHIHSFARHSRFPVWEVNTDLGFPRRLREVHPTVLVLHYSLFAAGRYLLGEEMHAFVRDADAFKVAYFQDEYHFCRNRFGFVKDVGVDLIYTHVHPEDLDAVWGRFTPRAIAHFNFPGYVDSEMVAAADRFALPDTERDIDVGYRGRPLPPYMGSGSAEKALVGDGFKERAASTSLRLDVDTSEEGRLYGEAWYRFLGRCRTILGVESGTSYLDLEDEVYHDYAARVAASRPVTFEALMEGPLGQLDHNYSYRTISPRHFEAAAFRICQVLFEGEYAGVLQPMVHYLPLKKDFSNFDEVVGQLRNDALRREITDNAHRDLIASGRYSYASLVGTLDEHLREAGLTSEASPAQRAAMDAALRDGRVRRRLLTEARYLNIGARMVIVRRVPQARELLRIPPEAV